ncbi:TetR/AcrR family transcriptional regulator [Thalassobacillus pellis]|uniref:TetR/AcrR family transcriptional regulator n=1 Tax=Thalassobacillus pellis TaxID=748008 RepID=UPI00195F58B3|nr:TetR/AcrR family transcriptional regulator [Thalassobacillus pellis]MBM7554502.1 AcrR family transcriptional regulator [Thalassobacillus pellis]
MDRESKRNKTKTLLLDATKTLVQEKGCSKMTLSDIMTRTGLSKGAIYHYVKSKDELLALVLQERMETIDDRFFAEVNQGKKEFENPLRAIVKNLPSLQEPQDPTNQIFLYLLSKNDQPVVRAIITKFYDQALQLSKRWITVAQSDGVIPLSVNADKTAELFLLISYGFRVRSSISTEDHAFNAEDYSVLMVELLQPKQK